MFAPRDHGQRTDDGGSQDAAGAQAGADGQAHLAANLKPAAQLRKSFGERLARHRKAMQPERGERDGKHIPRSARLQQLFGGAVFGDRGVTIGVASDHRLGNAPNLRLDGIGSVNLQRAVEHRAAPVEAERRRVGPAASQVDAGRRGDMNTIEAPA